MGTKLECCKSDQNGSCGMFIRSPGKSVVFHPAGLIAKFVISRCMFANFEWVFLFCQSFESGAVLITMQRTHPATKLRMTQDCSRLENNVIMSGFFFEGRRQTLLYSCKNKKDQKILRRKLVDFYPKRGDHKQVTLKHRNKQIGSKCTNHK